MKKFKCKVERIDEYIIEFDENIINKEWMEEFRKNFYNFTTLREHAEHLAQLRARSGNEFLEGYGTPLFNGRVFSWAAEPIEKGINIIIESEDSQCDVVIEEIKE